MLTQCFNCPAEWAPGSEDWQFQECGACGWRPGMPLDDDSDDDDEYDDYEDDDDDRYKPVDSRNL